MTRNPDLPSAQTDSARRRFVASAGAIGAGLGQRAGRAHRLRRQGARVVGNDAGAEREETGVHPPFRP